MPRGLTMERLDRGAVQPLADPFDFERRRGGREFHRLLASEAALEQRNRFDQHVAVGDTPPLGTQQRIEQPFRVLVMDVQLVRQREDRRRVDEDHLRPGRSQSA